MPAHGGERFLLLETAPVVFHAQAQAPRLQMEPDPDFTGSRMFQNVGHGFLRYAQHVLFHVLRQLPFVARDIDVHLDGRTSGPLARSRFERGT